MAPSDCFRCERPEVLPANQGAWEVFWSVAGLLGDGWGGVNLDNAEAAARALGYDWGEELFAKLTCLIRILLKKEDPPADDEAEDGGD